jgi:hypothetical protein
MNKQLSLQRDPIASCCAIIYEMNLPFWIIQNRYCLLVRKRPHWSFRCYILFFWQNVYFFFSCLRTLFLPPSCPFHPNLFCVLWVRVHIYSYYLFYFYITCTVNSDVFVTIYNEIKYFVLYGNLFFIKIFGRKKNYNKKKMNA